MTARFIDGFPPLAGVIFLSGDALMTALRRLVGMVDYRLGNLARLLLPRFGNTLTGLIIRFAA
jgi:hypothetical protein